MTWDTDLAQKRPLGPQTEPRLRKKNKILLHTMVGTLWGTDNYFGQSGYSGTESHMGVGGDGSALQWQDDEYQADANLEANDDALSIETEDMGPLFPDWDTSGDNVPPWTDAQIEKIAQIVARWSVRHDIPLVLIEDTEDSTRGIGYHRQGADPWRKHGGERYTEAYGKVCPGDARIAQIPQVIARAKQIIAGDGGEVEDDMPYGPNELRELMREANIQSIRDETEYRQEMAAWFRDVVLTDPVSLDRIAGAVMRKGIPRSAVEGETAGLAISRLRRASRINTDTLGTIVHLLTDNGVQVDESTRAKIDQLLAEHEQILAELDEEVEPVDPIAQGEGA